LVAVVVVAMALEFQVAGAHLVAVVAVEPTVLAVRLQVLQTLAVAVVHQAQLEAQAAVQMVVQVMHELLIGVNYGTTLCIS
jgi:hypothetical protein